MLPLNLAWMLGFDEPEDDQDAYLLSIGVGGVNVGFSPEFPIRVTLTDNSRKIRKSVNVFPIVHVGCAPVVSAASDFLHLNHRYYRKKCLNISLFPITGD